MGMKSLDIDFSLTILERMGKGEFSSSGCTLEGKKKRGKEVSFKGVSLELKMRGAWVELGHNLMRCLVNFIYLVIKEMIIAFSSFTFFGLSMYIYS